MKRLLLCLLSCVALSAQAGVVMVANKSIAGDLDKSKASKIMLGKTKKINGVKVELFELPEADATRAAFHSAVTGKSLAQQQSYWSRLLFTGKGTPPTEVPNAGAMKSSIAATPGGVGYIDEADLDDSVVVVFRP